MITQTSVIAHFLQALGLDPTPTSRHARDRHPDAARESPTRYLPIETVLLTGPAGR